MTKRKISASILLLFAATCLSLGFILCFGTGLFAGARTAENNFLKIETLDDKSEVLNNGYLDRYGVPTSKFTYKNNGEAEDGAPLSYAFDRSFNSVWRSKMQTVDAATINTVTVDFAVPTRIDRIVYQSDSSWYDRGYFNTLTLSYVDERGNTVKCDALSSDQTDKIVLVTLKSPATMREIVLEWTEVPTNHRRVAAASEIVFLQPHSEDVERVQSMFTDYAQLKLDRSKINGREDVEALRAKVKGYASYDTELSYLLNRAEQVLEGAVYYEPRREMGTDEASPNVILRHGDVAGYARSSLKFAWFGTNRQATGVSASPGEDLIVYVTGEEDDPLPSLVCTQHWGSWRSWKSGEYKLRLGKNVIKVPNYLQEGYTDNKGGALAAGGPVYLVDPYTPEQQSSSVKVYFEGGQLFPVFREDGDENAYKRILADYASAVQRDREDNASSKAYKIVDVTEIVSDRVILTVEASMADELYNGLSYSPQEATKAWDNYVDGILQFDGVVLDDDPQRLGDVGARYDERNRWVNVNIRLAQPYGAAYAYTEHIGIQVSWEAGAITAAGSFGWGYTHEIGHMLDIGERTVSECSNNMVSKYHETVIEGTAQRGDFAKTTAALSPDDHAASYWNTNRGNFILWWLIESYWPGYWARLDNLYRYEDVFKDFSEEEKKSLGAMSATEKQVYLSSLVVKEDLSYYFERWGYNLGTNDYIFEADGQNTSAAFKAVMARAKERGRIGKGTSPKLWYLDAAEWKMRYPDDAGSKLYGGTETPAIRSVTRSGDGYDLIMDIPTAEREAHLGFEIREGSSGTWKAIGFTYDKMFLDTASYGTRTPKYCVVAYDRALQASAVSEVFSPAAGSRAGVCETGGRKYDSLYEAVAAVGNGGTIRLLKDTSETGIVIDKTVRIELSSDCTILKGGTRPIFTVVSRRDEAGNVTAEGALALAGVGATLTLDGGLLSTAEPLVRVQGGSFRAEGCIFKDNIVKSGPDPLGGGLRIDGGRVTVERCTFTGNRARLGGGAYVGTREAEFIGCTFADNTATEGGGIYVGNTAILRECTFTGNTAELGGGFGSFVGGVAELHGCTFSENAAARGGAVYADGMLTVFGGTMSANTASENGAAICYARSTSNARPLYVYAAETGGAPLTVTENVCREGSAVYLYGETAAFTADVYGNDAKYALWLGGKSARLSGGRIGGSLFKEAATPVFVSLLPEPYGSKIPVSTDSEETSLVLFTAESDLTEEGAERFTTERGKVVLGGAREIRLEMEAFTVTLDVEGRTQTHNYLPGHSFTLEALGGGRMQTTYVSRWTDGGGVSHAVGEEIEVDRDMIFHAVVSQKAQVRFSIDAAAELSDIVYYVMPDESFGLPKIDPERFVFGGWEYQNGLYQAYETVSVREDRAYTARLTRKLSVSYALQREGETVVYETRYYPYGSKIDFVTCKDPALMPESGYINGFFVRNADGSYASDPLDFDTYTLQNDALFLLADVVDMPVYIMYSFTEDGVKMMGEPVTELAPRGSVYTISLRALPTGYHIVSLLLQPAAEDAIYFDRADLDGFELKLTDVYYIINADLTKNTYDVTYEINGGFYANRTMRYGDVLKLDDPTDTLLKDAFPAGTKYSFSSYRLVTSERGGELSEGGAAEMNVRLGDEIVISEDITVNMIVYVEGQERAPADAGSADLLMRKAEKRESAEEKAEAFLNELRADTTLGEEERSDYLARVERVLSEGKLAIEASTTAAELEEAYDLFAVALEGIREELVWKQGGYVRVAVGGLAVKGRAYDGTYSVELDLSGVVYTNADSGLPLPGEICAVLVPDASAVLSDKNAGVRTVTVTLLGLSGDSRYRLEREGLEVVLTVEIARAKLTVSLDEELRPVYSGFAEGEDESFLSGEPEIVYTTENGKRMATPRGISGENYDITFVGRAVEGSSLGLILWIAIPAAVLLVGGAALAFVLLGRKKRK